MVKFKTKVQSVNNKPSYLSPFYSSTVSIGAYYCQHAKYVWEVLGKKTEKYYFCVLTIVLVLVAVVMPYFASSF